MSREIDFQNWLKIRAFGLMMGSRKINILWLIVDLEKLYMLAIAFTLNNVMIRSASHRLSK